MASRASFSDDTRIIKKALPKALLLRDYLLDDMSSCSSNGFRSYPRQQCCTKIRFLVESDLQRSNRMYSKHSIVESKINWRSNLKPKPKVKQSSLVQKASTVMIKAFKRLTYAGVSTKAKVLPRSLSWKLGFWKKTELRDNEVKRLTTFGDLINMKEITPSPSPSRLSTAVGPTITPELTSSTSNSNSNSDSSWSASDLTATSESLTNGNNSEVEVAQNDVVKELTEKKKTNGTRVGVTTATVTVTNYSDATEKAQKWQGNQDEQSSPVSVMDFPTNEDNDIDEDEEVSSASPHKRLNVKGMKRVSERVYQLHPVKLEDRIAQSVLESSTTSLDSAHEENQIEKKAMALLQLLKSTVSSLHILEYEAVESLLLGFLIESVHEENVSDYEMLQRAKSWMDGKEEEVGIDWECEDNRKSYLREMEKEVKWSNYDHQAEKVNVGLEVECEIFYSLVNDMLTEFNLQEFDYED